MKKLLFFGDSITEMCRHREFPDNHVLNLGSGFVFVLASEFARTNPGQYYIINKGIGGNEIKDLFARYKEDVLPIDSEILNILVGVNDVCHLIENRGGSKLDEFEDKYCEMIEDILDKRKDLKIIICESFVLKGSATTPYISQYQSLMPQYQAVVKKIAEKYNLYFLPLQEAFNKKANELDSSLLLYDGIHPNILGANLIADEWMKFYNKNFDK